MAVNAIADAPAAERGATNANDGPATAEGKRGRLQKTGRGPVGEVRIYQHSSLLYWWVVWFYGFLCAAVTYAQGVGIADLAARTADSPDKVILFHPSPWLGISYIGVVLFVVVFTNVRARGVYSFMLLMVSAAIIWGIQKIPGIETAFAWAALVRVYLNLAFYLTFSALLLGIWLFVVGFVDHFTWWRFSPGQVIEEHRIGQATGHAFNTEGMIVRRLPNDLFRHRILGFGTGDFVVEPAQGGAFEIHNVWRASTRQRLIERMIATRVMSAES